MHFLARNCFCRGLIQVGVNVTVSRKKKKSLRQSMWLAAGRSCQCVLIVVFVFGSHNLNPFSVDQIEIH